MFYVRTNVSFLWERRQTVAEQVQFACMTLSACLPACLHACLPPLHVQVTYFRKHRWRHRVWRTLHKYSVCTFIYIYIYIYIKFFHPFCVNNVIPGVLFIVRTVTVERAVLLPHSDRRSRPHSGAASRDDQEKTLYDVRYSKSSSYCIVDH
jgi:hypothetical protein